MPGYFRIEQQWRQIVIEGIPAVQQRDGKRHNNYQWDCDEMMPVFKLESQKQ